jgi:hypothetical protein
MIGGLSHVIFLVDFGLALGLEFFRIMDFCSARDKMLDMMDE